jgi:hypothetical protein
MPIGFMQAPRIKGNTLKRAHHAIPRDTFLILIKIPYFGGFVKRAI